MAGRVGDLTDPERIRKVLDDVGLVVVGLAGERPEGFRLRPVDLMPLTGDRDDTDDVERFKLLLLAPRVFRLDDSGALFRPLAELPNLGRCSVVDDFLELGWLLGFELIPALLSD